MDERGLGKQTYETISQKRINSCINEMMLKREMIRHCELHVIGYCHVMLRKSSSG